MKETEQGWVSGNFFQFADGSFILTNQLRLAPHAAASEAPLVQHAAHKSTRPVSRARPLNRSGIRKRKTSYEHNHQILSSNRCGCPRLLWTFASESFRGPSAAGWRLSRWQPGGGDQGPFHSHSCRV